MVGSSLLAEIGIPFEILKMLSSALYRMYRKKNCCRDIYKLWRIFLKKKFCKSSYCRHLAVAQRNGQFWVLFGPIGYVTLNDTGPNFLW